MGNDGSPAKAKGRRLTWNEYVDAETKIFVSDGRESKEIIGYKFDPVNNHFTVYLEEPDDAA